MIDEIYRLFKRNLPYIERGEETVTEILSYPENHFILHRARVALAGVSVNHRRALYLLRVQ